MHEDSYEYDSVGRRVLRNVNGSQTVTVWDGAQVIAEYVNGSLTKKYLYGPGIDNPVVMVSGGNRYYYYADALGSIRMLSDAAGDIVESYAYDPFGLPLVMLSAGTDGNWLTEDVSWFEIGYGWTGYGESQIGNPYLFTGRRWDSMAGIYYYRFRDYCPNLGRFLQPDPIGYIDGMNLYAYCGNNPINWVDPWGLATIIIYVERGLPWGETSLIGTIRSGRWGHVWVEIRDDNGNIINRGFYPQGLRDDTLRNPKASAYLTYGITQEQAENARRYIDNYNEEYNAFSENCADFGYKIMEEGAGIDIPGSDLGIDWPDNMADDFAQEVEQMGKCP